ncbi:MAG: YjjW family glycine radical enzyme activase [Caulobacteraceae bacterium]
MTEALINKILPFSSVDGPGNRTVIFFQGCNFNCLYCHNPETINRCNGCGECIKVCPAGALSKDSGKISWNSVACLNCDACFKECRFGSSPKTKVMSVDEVLNAVNRVRAFISGITVSGGECMLQKEFLLELFNEVHKLDLTAFVDSNGSLDFSKEEELVNVLDAVMLDIKSYDNEEHKMLTGAANGEVLKNAAYLAEKNKLYEVRTVIVPGILDNKQNVDRISQYIASLNPEVRYKLISYRPVGVRENMRHIPVPSVEMMEKLKNIAQTNGCKNVIIV